MASWVMDPIQQPRQHAPIRFSERFLQRVSRLVDRQIASQATRRLGRCGNGVAY